MKRIDITKLEMVKVERNINGTPLNVFAQIFFEGKLIAEIRHNFMTNEFFGCFMLFNKCGDVFKKNILLTSMTEIQKFGNLNRKEAEQIIEEMRELKFSEIKTKTPEINKIIDFFNQKK